MDFSVSKLGPVTIRWYAGLVMKNPMAPRFSDYSDCIETTYRVVDRAHSASKDAINKIESEGSA